MERGDKDSHGNGEVMRLDNQNDSTCKPHIVSVKPEAQSHDNSKGGGGGGACAGLRGPH